jgi:transglutaminase-like putative cysteine protease
MKRLRVEHHTIYRYARAVAFGPHRLVFRPRDSHDLRLVATRLLIEPAATLRWLHDPFGNSVAVATFTAPATELRFESMLEIEHYGVGAEATLERANAWWPFEYNALEAPDLAASIAREPDPEERIEAWAKRFIWGGNGMTPARALLASMAEAVRSELTYAPREGEGVQTPSETLAKAAGSCRDFSVLMIEACRALGIAARFVSGYLYDPKLDVDEPPEPGTTHAWVAVFIPGEGWIEIDPTNGLLAGDNLVRIAVARDPAQIAPLSGTFAGDKDDYLGMDVDVRVRSLPE